MEKVFFYILQNLGNTFKIAVCNAYYACYGLMERIGKEK